MIGKLEDQIIICQLLKAYKKCTVFFHAIAHMYVFVYFQCGICIIYIGV